MPRIKSNEIEYKETRVKGLLDKVTATLSGSQSATFTKLAARYKKLDNLIKRVTEARNALNEDIKTKAEALFDAEDEMLTRVVETVSLTANISKRTPAGERDVEYFDTEGFIEELMTTFPKLADQIKEIEKGYHKINKVPTAARSPALRVKVKEDVSQEEALDMVEKYSEALAKLVMQNIKPFDAKIAELKAQL